MGNGPRNNDEDRLRKPPSPKHKSPLRIKMLRLFHERPMTNQHGNTELECDCDIVHSSDLHVTRKWMCDPETEFVFWVSQNSSHSVVFYNNEFYALMAVGNITKAVEGKNYRQKIGKVLGIQKTNFEPKTVEWIKDEISNFLIPVSES